MPLKLKTLAPEFSEARHGTYLEALERAIASQPEARNIALAGAYGVGKSSVLGELATRRANQVIKISLLTLGAGPEDSPASSESNPAARTTSNRIQKEIVKQLLYQQSPARTPQSRFRRIVRPRQLSEWVIAAVGGIIALFALFGSGLLVPAAASLEIDVWSPPQLMRLVTFAAVALVLAMLIVRLIRSVLSGHVGIEKVAAGPATISLPPRSASYFDEYLDEIIYFFEVDSRRDIVIIEDLDRFNDPGIYESLRSLNGLLNSAQQLRGRNIRFIYAVRDSIFEGQGVTPSRSTATPSDETERGNRTKFFDLIIPMVPFITHRNARDLLHAALTARGHAIPRPLVDLAARHVPDMRLIHNIVNEYDVFKRQLLDVAQPVPELDVERLFSLVLFKNTEAADFEAIRRGDSSLDRLFETWRDFVGANADHLRRENSRLQLRIEQNAADSEHAAEIGQRLQEVIDLLVDAPGSMLASNDLSVDGANIDAAAIQTAEFWQNFRQNHSLLTLTLQATRYDPSPKMTLTAEAIETLLGVPINSAGRSSLSADEDREEMRRNGASLEFLNRHSWKALLERDDFVMARESVPSSTFRQWAEYLLPSRLAVDLVTQGYITSYFPLHVSSFYGQLIRPDAMTYIMRNVDTNSPDPGYPLGPEDVEAIIVDQGEDVLAESSMRNVSVLDYLLSSNQGAAETVIRSLPGDGQAGLSFIHHYLSAGRHLDRFIAIITPYWSFVFDYLVGDAPLTASDRVKLFSIAIDHRSNEQFSLGAQARSFVAGHVGDISALSEPASETAAEQAVEFLTVNGVVIPDVSVLSERARHAICGTRSYQFTAANVQVLSGSVNLALDALRLFRQEVYEYAIDEPAKYVTARIESSVPGLTVDNSSLFAGILQDARSWSGEAAAVLIRDAHLDCRIADLREAPFIAWPSLASEKRTDVTFSNVQAYLEQFGALDGFLEALLSDAEALIWDASADEESRVEVALQLINARVSFLPDPRRVALAASLGIGPVTTALVEPQTGDLLGLLLEAQLIEDDEEAFSPRLMVDWSTQEFAIDKSVRFVEIVGPDTLSVVHIGALMESDVINDSVRRALVARLDEYETLPSEACDGIASATLRGQVNLTATQVTTVVQGGWSQELALELLAFYGDALPLLELRRGLRSLGGNLAVVADKGRRRVSLPASPAIRLVLARLQAAGIVSQVKDAERELLKVTLRHS